MPQRPTVGLTMPEYRHAHPKGQALHDLFMEVFKLHMTLSDVRDKVHAEVGLVTSQRKIMGTLDAMGPATVPDMAAALKVSRQFVQNVCNDLDAKGYILFLDNPRHKRSKLVELTASGRLAHQQARQREHEIIEQTLPQVVTKNVEMANDLLKGIRLSIENKWTMA